MSNMKRYAVTIVWGNGLTCSVISAVDARLALGAAIATNKVAYTMPINGYVVVNIDDEDDSLSS